MTRKTYTTLVQAAENITPGEMCEAPELSTLVALDATLHATISLLEFNYPSPGNPKAKGRDIADGVEEFIVDSIFVLAKALRTNLAAYYAAIQENSEGYESLRQYNPLEKVEF